jgi:hypothetical protein
MSSIHPPRGSARATRAIQFSGKANFGELSIGRARMAGKNRRYIYTLALPADNLPVINKE